MKTKLLITLLGAMSLPTLIHAQETPQPIRIEDGYGDAFVNYKPYVSPGKKNDPKKAPDTPAVPKPEKKAEPEAVTVKWLRENYPVLEERAINNPTKENVEAYSYVKRVVLDKSQRFQSAVSKVVNEDPLLNENNRVPYASSGSQMIQAANYEAQQQAVRELAEIGGLIVFVDSTCRFCAKQLPIITSVKNNFGLNYLVVSIDGSSPKGYGGAIQKDNGLYNKLGLKLTPSIVYVPKPTGYASAVDPNKYLIVAQGYYAQDELVKQIAFAGHNTKLLSQSTMKDLNVWDRGVASQEDLKALKLDVNNPKSIKQTLQPLLLKQYQ